MRSTSCAAKIYAAVTVAGYCCVSFSLFLVAAIFPCAALCCVCFLGGVNAAMNVSAHNTETSADSEESWHPGAWVDADDFSRVELHDEIDDPSDTISPRTPDAFRVPILYFFLKHDR